VALDWEKSVYVEAEPGYYLTIARKAKDTGLWFVGNVNGFEGRTGALKFDFLDADKTYLAELYADQPIAHFKTNPQAYQISTWVVDSKSVLRQYSAPGGGYAIRIREVSKEEAKGIKKLK
jgi:hypothetical protein